MPRNRPITGPLATASADVGDWSQYEKLVLVKLDEHTQTMQRMRSDTGKLCVDVSALQAQFSEHNDAIRQIREDTARLRVDVGGLKIRAGMWGAAMGVIPAIGAALYWLLSR